MNRKWKNILPWTWGAVICFGVVLLQSARPLLVRFADGTTLSAAVLLGTAFMRKLSRWGAFDGFGYGMYRFREPEIDYGEYLIRRRKKRKEKGVSLIPAGSFFLTGAVVLCMFC